MKQSDRAGSFWPLDICRRRNIERQDRFADQSDEEAELMNMKIVYSMKVDTDRYLHEECAERIVKELCSGL